MYPHIYLRQNCLTTKFLNLILSTKMRFTFFIGVLSFSSFWQRQGGNCWNNCRRCGHSPFQVVVRLSESKSLKYSTLPWKFMSRRNTISHHLLLVLWSWTWLLLLMWIWLFSFVPLLPRCLHASHFSCGTAPVEEWDFTLDNLGWCYYIPFPSIFVTNRTLLLANP